MSRFLIVPAAFPRFSRSRPTSCFHYICPFGKRQGEPVRRARTQRPAHVQCGADAAGSSRPDAGNASSAARAFSQTGQHARKLSVFRTYPPFVFSPEHTIAAVFFKPCSALLDTAMADDIMIMQLELSNRKNQTVHRLKTVRGAQEEPPCRTTMISGSRGSSICRA